MRRRDFVAGLGGAAMWPIEAWAQQRRAPVIGYLHAGTANDFAVSRFVAAFREGLSQQGYIEKRNIEVLYRWAEFDYSRLPELAAELVRRRVAVIFAGPAPAAVAAKSATTNIPIVFVTGGDPMGLGLVESLNRPTGNVTGVGFLTTLLTAKRLELLHEMVPGATVISHLLNPTNPNFEAERMEAETAARVLGVQVVVLLAKNPEEIARAFGALAVHQIGAVLVTPDALTLRQRDQLVALAASHAVPAMYNTREFVDAGGLMSYGASIVDASRLGGTYVGRLLNGEKPSDLPVQQSTRFEMVLNLKTAKALGIEVPTATLLRATEVIE